MTYPKFLIGLVAVVALAAFAKPDQKTPADYVNPMIGASTSEKAAGSWGIN